MSYSTLTEILKRIPSETVLQLTDDLDNGALDAAKVDAAIARADQEIDTWCRAGYQVPFAPVPEIIAGLSADMAIYYLYGRTVDEIPEARKDAYHNAVKLLEKVANGQIKLGAAQVSVSTPGSAELLGGNGRLFTRDKLRGM